MDNVDSVPETVSVKDGVLTLAVSTQSAGNSLDESALTDATRALNRMSKGEIDVGAVVIRGLGSNFCSGGNVRGFAAAKDRSAHVDALAALLHEFLLRLSEVQVPVIAAVQGWAAGAGLSLVLNSDIAVGDSTTRLRPAYPGIGLSPDGAMTLLLPRAVGMSRARHILLTDAVLDGQTAYSIGILGELADAESNAVDRAYEIAHRLADGPRTSLSAIKKLLQAAGTATLAEQLDAERESIARLVAHPDGIEGVDAFIEKRRPSFGS